jgi:hypothetical protein
MKHFTSFFLKFKLQIAGAKSLFLLNVGFAMEILHLAPRILHLPERQAGEAWTPSNKKCPRGYRRISNKKLL